jgi:hypothetical protein
VRSHLTRWRAQFREAGLSVILAIQVMIVFVVAPLASTGRISLEVTEMLRFGLALVAILIVTTNRLLGVAIAATFMVSLFLSHQLRIGAGGAEIYPINILVTTAFDLAVTWTVARAVFGPGKITVHRILGAVILYIYVGLIFANIYRVMAVTVHPSFSGTATSQRMALSEMLYFSFGTLTTTGFGDILPLHPFVRSLANMEAVIGQLFPATLLARLVTLHSSNNRT